MIILDEGRGKKKEERNLNCVKIKNCYNAKKEIQKRNVDNKNK